MARLVLVREEDGVAVFGVVVVAAGGKLFIILAFNDLRKKKYVKVIFGRRQRFVQPVRSTNMAQR